MTPEEIEEKSLAIISDELRRLRSERLEPGGDNVIERNSLEETILRRVIHTSADFDYDRNLVFTHDAADRALNAVRKGCVIVTDTLMALSGINKRSLSESGSRVLCFIADEDVARTASVNRTTRSAAAVDKAAALKEPLLFAVGNAPTALLRIRDLVKEGILKPEAVIGVPVGFVNVIEAKEAMLELDIPCIIARGRKGGSPIAAAIINALLYYGEPRRRP
jgi:precorrin-8X/cobalt-precorrin-8 methylmutase